MAEPVPVREPVVDRATLLLTATWLRYVDLLRQRLAQQDARLQLLEARVAALETGP